MKKLDLSKVKTIDELEKLAYDYVEEKNGNKT